MVMLIWVSKVSRKAKGSGHLHPILLKDIATVSGPLALLRDVHVQDSTCHQSRLSSGMVRQILSLTVSALHTSAAHAKTSPLAKVQDGYLARTSLIVSDAPLVLGASSAARILQTLARSVPLTPLTRAP